MVSFGAAGTPHTQAMGVCICVLTHQSTHSLNDKKEHYINKFIAKNENEK